MSAVHLPRVVAFGECMIELRETAPAVMRRSFGGDTLNTALYLARLAQGHFSVAYATGLGDDDPYSTEMVAAWQAEGIDTGLVSRHAGELPGLYSIQVDSQGERRFSYWRKDAPARRYFSREGVNSPLEINVATVDLLHISGISLAILPPEGRERLYELMQSIRQRGGQVVFDNNYRPRLWSSVEEARAAFERAYALASIALITLDDELGILQSQDEEVALAVIAHRHIPEAIIKRGAMPTLVCVDGAPPLGVPALKVAKVVDTTAAGDSFGAGYVAARLRGLSATQAAAVGNRLAAQVIQHPGAIIPMDAMPDNLFS